MSQPTKWSQFGTLITVFFFWGFVAASNDILIPVFKKAFNLSQAQSQLVSVAFYVAYTVGSLIYFGISKLIGNDVLNKIGYKNGIVVGLIISAIGTLLFYPAANNASFTLMITGLFIVGLGFSLQQIAANPLAVIVKVADRIANTRYSQKQGSSMYSKYCAEYPKFRNALYNANHINQYPALGNLWAILDQISRPV